MGTLENDQSTYWDVVCHTSESLLFVPQEMGSNGNAGFYRRSDNPRAFPMEMEFLPEMMIDSYSYIFIIHIYELEEEPSFSFFDSPQAITGCV